jgi:hypothetical protein
MPAVRTPGFTWAVASRVTAFNESSEGGRIIGATSLDPMYFALKTAASVLRS